MSRYTYMIDTALSKMKHDNVEELNKSEKDIIIRALERQKIKRALVLKGGVYNLAIGQSRIFIDDMIECPYCHTCYSKNTVPLEFCPDCGQNLEWSRQDFE